MPVPRVARRAAATPTMRRRRFSATIEDVARHAGVSIATVSRVMNHRGEPGREIVLRVNAAVAELGYAPRAAAQGLKRRLALAVGAIVPSLQIPAFARFAETLEATLARHSFALFTACSHDRPDDEFAAARRLLGVGIDAVVLVGAYQRPELVSLLAMHRIATLRTFTIAVSDGIASVGIDNYRAAFDLATHVLDLGHRRIGVIAGMSRSNDRAAARLSGFRDAMAARAVPWSDELCIERPLLIAEGQAAARSLLGRTDRPTALICGSDLLAFGAVTQAQREGFRIPDDLSIASFDDFDFAAHFAEPLTTIHVPVEAMAEAAARELLTGLADESPMRSIELPCPLIVRASTAPPE
jgi:LacI family transcriptional regulator